ncbi:MAG: uracil-DNA glycosylase [Gemmatimonadota bacterium]|nr:MAG: uracil-DNA glycosylase [Gemmatimonadota bacterium]
MSDLTDLSQGDLFAPPDPIVTCKTIDELHGLVRDCSKCDELAEYRTQAVPGVGPPDARVVFIGEAPGRWEDKKGEPFVGDAGAYLTELLEKIGLQRSQVFITNIVKCRPPDNRNPKTSEMDSCAPYLERQLALIKPDLVVLLGRFALERFFPKEKITEAAAVPRRKAIGGRELTFLPMLHPAFGIRRQDLKPEIERQFWKIREVLDAL